MKKASPEVNLEGINPDVVKELLHIEKILGKELVITSGFRDKTHPIEAKKKSPGEHYGDGFGFGLAVDVACLTPQDFYDLTAAAIEVGCERIGISRKNNFIHLGFSLTRPKSIWVY